MILIKRERYDCSQYPYIVLHDEGDVYWRLNHDDGDVTAKIDASKWEELVNGANGPRKITINDQA